MNVKRRDLLLAMAGAMVGIPGVSASKNLVSTPRQTAGPFYPLELPLDDDNDLTFVKGRDAMAQGQVTDLGGRILDINGQPLRNLRIEIWQCDINGRYRHPYERGSQPRDENFQGHGHTITDERGGYRFRTIRPVPYPGRTPHIHVAVFPENEKPFVTQLYVRGDPRNQDDFLFNHVPGERRHLVTAEFLQSGQEGGSLEARFDIILDRHDGTPMDGSA